MHSDFWSILILTVTERYIISTIVATDNYAMLPAKVHIRFYNHFQLLDFITTLNYSAGFKCFQKSEKDSVMRNKSYPKNFLIWSVYKDMKETLTLKRFALQQLFLIDIHAMSILMHFALQFHPSNR